MSTQKEAAAQLTGVATQLGGVKTSLQSLIAVASNADSVSPQLQAAIDSTVQSSQQLADALSAFSAGDTTPPAAADATANDSGTAAEGV